MLKHIVMWKIKDFSNSEEKVKTIVELKSRLENLKSVIIELKGLEVGINDPLAAQDNWDVVLYTEFENLEALKTYQMHPAHIEVGAYVKKVTAQRVCVDYSI